MTRTIFFSSSLQYRMMTLIVVLAMAVSTMSAQRSKEFTASALKAIGAPNDPKVEIAWNRYYDYEQVTEIMQRIVAAYPDLASLQAIGTSVEGKPMWLLTVSDRRNGDPDSKPAIYIDGNIHSNEIQGAEVSLYTAWYCTELYGRVPWITQLLQEKTFYILPTINPDARDHFIHKPNNMHSPRTGLSPRDDDGDGEYDEDGYDDLDGDGNIVMMRIKDPNGRWKSDPDDPRLMVEARPDEKGAYTLLGWEGIDNDGDGRVNEDGPGFYDPNRDWGWNWAPRYVQYGADRFPFVLPETRAVTKFFLSHPNIASAQSFHNNGGMILRGPGAQDDEPTYSRQDIRTYDFLGELGEEQLPGYKYMVVWKDLYTVYGGELDWMYGARGILTFSNELWSEYDYFRRVKDTTRSVTDNDLYRFDKILLFNEGVVPWHPVHHPQYGDIEVGGPKKAWTRMPPSFMIEDMCHRNMAFTLFNLYQTPHVSVDSLYAVHLPGGLTEVTAIVANDRIIPTHTFQDVKNTITPPDVVSLSGAAVITGGVLENRLMGIVKEQKRDPKNIKVENIPGMGTVSVRWIVRGKGPYTVSVVSLKGGKAQRTR